MKSSGPIRTRGDGKKRHRRGTAGALALAAVGTACGGAPATGPSQIPSTTSAAPSPGPRAIPTWVDPAYVGTLILLDGGVPKHWAGGAFHHCIGPTLDDGQRAYVEHVERVMSEVSGVGTTEAGPCNVTWDVDDAAVIAIGVPGARAYSELKGTSTAIASARVLFMHYAVFDAAEHESGHVLGLGHSPKRSDCMFASGGVDEFSPDERAVLAWIYGH